MTDPTGPLPPSVAVPPPPATATSRAAARGGPPRRWPLVLAVVLVVAIVAGAAFAIVQRSDEDPPTQTGPAVTTTTSQIAVDAEDPCAVAGNGSTGAATAAACELNLRSAESAVQLYTAANDGPPPDLEALVPGFLPEVPEGVGYTPEAGVALVAPCA